MSVKVYDAVWSSDVSEGRLVLLALADNANDAGWCWPGIAYIAGKCQIHRSTVFRQLEKLEGQGLIGRRERRRPNGSQRSNMYRINVPELHRRKREVTQEELDEMEDFKIDFDVPEDVLVG